MNQTKKEPGPRILRSPVRFCNTGKTSASALTVRTEASRGLVNGSLFDLDFIRNHENAIFLDPPGVGKTHLAIALATKACCHGYKIYFTTMDTLMRKRKDPTQSRHKACLTSGLVVVDEVGYLPIDSREAYLFFQFVSYRYEINSTIITSNKSFGDWQELFGDPVIATAILARLLHHCWVVNINGHGYRLRKHQIGKTGVPKAK